MSATILRSIRLLPRNWAAQSEHAFPPRAHRRWFLPVLLVATTSALTLGISPASAADTSTVTISASPSTSPTPGVAPSTTAKPAPKITPASAVQQHAVFVMMTSSLQALRSNGSVRIDQSGVKTVHSYASGVTHTNGYVGGVRIEEFRKGKVTLASAAALRYWYAAKASKARNGVAVDAKILSSLETVTGFVDISSIVLDGKGVDVSYGVAVSSKLLPNPSMTGFKLRGSTTVAGVTTYLFEPKSASGVVGSQRLEFDRRGRLLVADFGPAYKATFTYGDMKYVLPGKSSVTTLAALGTSIGVDLVKTFALSATAVSDSATASSKG